MENAAFMSTIPAQLANWALLITNPTKWLTLADLKVAESLLALVAQCWLNRQNYIGPQLAPNIDPTEQVTLAQCLVSMLATKILSIALA